MPAGWTQIYISAIKTKQMKLNCFKGVLNWHTSLNIYDYGYKK